MSVWGVSEMRRVGLDGELTGSHVACDMLRTSEGRIADGAFVITGHWEEGREER